MYLWKQEKSWFLGNKTLTQRFGANLKNPFFAPNLLLLHFFGFLAQKMLKMNILTSVWGVQHPNAGRNIQHTQIGMRWSWSSTSGSDVSPSFRFLSWKRLKYLLATWQKSLLCFYFKCFCFNNFLKCRGDLHDNLTFQTHNSLIEHK